MIAAPTALLPAGLWIRTARKCTLPLRPFAVPAGAVVLGFRAGGCEPSRNLTSPMLEYTVEALATHTCKTTDATYFYLNREGYAFVTRSE